jgi:hypothetical protein
VWSLPNPLINGDYHYRGSMGEAAGASFSCSCFDPIEIERKIKSKVESSRSGMHLRMISATKEMI